MKQFLIVLLTATILQAHMIKDAFLDTRTNAPDSSVTQLLTTSTMTTRSLTIDSLAPNNVCIDVRRSGNYCIPLVKLTQNSAITTGRTFMGWFRIRAYKNYATDSRLRGFCVTRSVLGYNPWGDSTQVWLELNKTRTQLTLVYASFRRPTQKDAVVWTFDSLKSNLFAPLDTNKYYMISYTYPLLHDLHDSTLIKIKFYINGTPCGVASKASFGWVCKYMPINTGIANYIVLSSMWLQQPDSGFATGGAITYKRELTATQIKAVYDTNQTHNLRYQRSLSAVELAPAKPVISISCASLNPGLVHIPGNTMQIIAINGSVLHTLETATGSIMLPRLTTGRYFLKTDNLVKPIFISH